MSPPKVITIFGSSRPHEGEPAYEEARRLGRLLGASGFTICNGGYGGVMEATSRGAKESGGKTVGITTQEFRSQANVWVDQEKKMPTWRDRLFQLIEEGSAYVVLNGGTGTLVELACVWEMTRKNLIPPKPILVLGRFWQEAAQFLLQNEEIEKSSSFYSVKSPQEAVEVLEKVLVG